MSVDFFRGGLNKVDTEPKDVGNRQPVEFAVRFPAGEIPIDLLESLEETPGRFEELPNGSIDIVTTDPTELSSLLDRALRLPISRRRR